mmetsp:Transcript_790/g.1633  ORF Transcript_790/g.1633 Transcript_790/m.1633 type:complete len:248 (-) Transcript_790:36-779(-)
MIDEASSLRPVPSAVQDVPSHLATLFAETPPIVVKSPAAYRCPEVGSKAKLLTDQSPSQLEPSSDQPVPTLLKSYIATHASLTIQRDPPAYKIPRASSYAKAKTEYTPDPIASHDEPVHLATFSIDAPPTPSKDPPTNISSPVAPATTAFTRPTAASTIKGSETFSNSNAVALDKFDSHNTPDLAIISTSPASTNARGGTNPCATASSIAHAFLHPDIPRAHRQPLARLARVDAPNAPISRKNNSST